MKSRRLMNAMLSICLAGCMMFSPSLTVFAGSPSNNRYTSSVDGSKYSGTGHSVTYKGQFEQKDPNTIMLDLTRSSDNKTFSGLDATDRSNGFTYNNNLDAVLKNAGISNGTKALEALGVYMGSDGRWKMPDGTNLSVINLDELKNPPGDPPPTPVPTPTPGGDGCTEQNSYNWCLVEVSVTTNNAQTNGSSHRIETGIPYDVGGPNGTLYSNGGSLESKFNNSSGWSDSWSRPQWTSLDVTYTAKWELIERKYIMHNDCDRHCSWCDGDEFHGGHWSSHNHYTEGPIYSIADTAEESRSTAYDAELFYVDWIEESPIDLTSETTYTGPYTVTNNHGYTNVKSPLDRNVGTVPVTVSKTSFNAGQTLSLLSTNEPGEFFVDFGDSWFGIRSSENLDGGNTYKADKEVGYQWVSWAELWYGGDHAQDSRGEKINTITKLNSAATAGAETTQSEKLYVNSGQPYAGKFKFNLRSVYPTSNGSLYYLGEGGNNIWMTYFEECRNNLKGVDWHASCSSTPGSLEVGKDNEDYTKYVIWNLFRQPILYGEYDVKTPAAR